MNHLILSNADSVILFTKKQSNSTSKYLNDPLNIDNIHFEQMVHGIYPTELQLKKANASHTEAAFIDLNVSIYSDTVSTKIYDISVP